MSPIEDVLEQLSSLELPPSIKAVGLTHHRNEPAVLVVLGASGLRALSALELPLPELRGLSVVLREIPGELRATAYLPAAQQQALTPEQEALEPVVLGAQVQNGSADERLGGYGVGTLGVFATDAEGRAFLLSNNHVIAAENAGLVGDEIFQAQRSRGRAVGRLESWIPLKSDGPNRVDIAAAAMLEDAAFDNAFLELRKRPRPAGLVAPRVGLRVFKVGRTSGLTLGSITAVEARIPRVGYGFGSASFEGSFIIEGLDGATFSAPGDSGSGIYDSRGRLAGFLYAGDGTITLACPAGEALEALSLSLSGA